MLANGGEILVDRAQVVPKRKDRRAWRDVPAARTTAAAILITITASAGFGQQARPRFEVASIKPSKDRSFTGMDTHPGGRLTANAPLAVLIANAYRVKRFQILGGPSWINSDLYRIEAKAEGRASAAGMLLALQTLLEDRFKLKIERQTKELGVYALTVGKGGIKQQELNAAGCREPDTNQPPAAPRPGQPPCGRIRMTISPVKMQLEGRRVSIADLIERLSNFVDRPIIDRTGYIGTLDVELEFTPDPIAFGLLGGDIMEGGPPPPDDSATTPLSAAVREQLGLKLESAKGSAAVIMIRHVERPSAN